MAWTDLESEVAELFSGLAVVPRHEVEARGTTRGQQTRTCTKCEQQYVGGDRSNFCLQCRRKPHKTTLVKMHGKWHRVRIPQNPTQYKDVSL